MKRISMLNQEQTLSLAYIEDDDLVAHVKGNQTTLNPIEDFFSYQKPADLENFRLEAEVDSKYKATTVNFKNDTKEGVNVSVELLKNVEKIFKSFGYDAGLLKVYVPNNRPAPICFQIPSTHWYFLVAPRIVT